MIQKYSDNPIFYFFHESCKQFGDLILEVVRKFYKMLHILFHFIQVIIYCKIKKKKKPEEKEIPERLRYIM